MPSFLIEAGEWLYGLYEGAEAAGGIYALAANLVVTVAATFALNKIEQALAGKKSSDGQPPSREVTTRGTVEYQQLIYGQIKTGGYLAYINTSGVRTRNLLLAYLDQVDRR